MVTRIDRLARSLKDLQDIVHELKAKGVTLKATEQPIDTGTAAGKAFLDMLGVFAEFETNLRRERQLEGIQAAKARGVYKGRRPSIDRGRSAPAAGRGGARAGGDRAGGSGSAGLRSIACSAKAGERRPQLGMTTGQSKDQAALERSLRPNGDRPSGPERRTKSHWQPEAGPSLAVAAGGRYAWTDVVTPLHWVLIDLRLSRPWPSRVPLTFRAGSPSRDQW